MEEKNTKEIKNKKSLYIFIGMVVAVIIILVFVFPFGNITGGVINSNEKNEIGKGIEEFNQCLADNGIVIYGSEWCPYCKQLVETLGGYNALGSVYVECTKEEQRCQQEMIGRGVPEIQINGKMYQGSRSLEGLSQATGCPIPK
jgi:glutaredoxin